MYMKKILVLAAVLCAPAMANALQWDYSGSGSCTFGCTGAVTVVGTINGNPTLLGNASTLLGAEVFGYSFNMSGAINETYNGLFGVGSYGLDPYAQITSGSMTFGDLIALEFLGVGSANWTFTDSRLGFFGLVTQRTAAGTGGYQVPEPGSLALLGGGLLALGFMRRRRKGA